VKKKPNASLGQNDVLAALGQFAKLRVAVVGETIIDEYVYCDAMGKSGKEPILVSRYISSECHGGGAIAVANHLADFCAQVTLVSALGAEEPREEFVRSALRPEVIPHFIAKQKSPTIVKRRYLDAYSLAKMMGIYHLNPAPLGSDDDRGFCGLLDQVLPACDVVIVADYGHGLITPQGVARIGQAARFVAVNTQMNAANHGYHTLSKYPRADYVCLHEGELRLDARDSEGDIRGLIERAAARVGAAAFTVTRGRAGTLLYRTGDGFFESPSLAEEVVERVGAGDAVLALTSLGVACELSPEVIGLIGNLAGAQQVAVVGNSASVSKDVLVARVRDMLPAWSNQRRAIAL
jgi:bifunctional ADP-heptose synthase (sugar kinase/adenylyltransferase)